MFTDLFNWFDCFDTHTSISDFLADVFSGNAADILKKDNDNEKKDLKDAFLSKYVSDGHEVSYVYYVFTDNKKEIHDKCEEIISSFEEHPIYLDKVDVKIRINFPNQKLSFVYKWDKNQKCFIESCESEEEKTVENKEQNTDAQINLNVDGKQIPNPYEKKEDVHMGKGYHLNIGDYNFVSRYGNISIISIAGRGMNFIDADGNIMSDDWYDEIEDFRNGYCVALKDEHYCIINTNAERVSGFYSFVDEMTFTDGWCLVKRDDGKFNFVNPGGWLISDAWFDQACKFHKGFAVVSGEENNPKSKEKYNLIDVNGDYISYSWFDYVGNFDTFQAPITFGGHSGYIDMQGVCFFPDGFSLLNKKVVEKVVGAKQPEGEVKKQETSKSDIITDESDERLVFMPMSALSILKDLINEKKFNILEDEGIAVTIDELTALDTESDSYADCIDKIIENESLMLDRFCKYAKNTFGFSDVIWRRTNNGNNIIFEFYL